MNSKTAAFLAAALLLSATPAFAIGAIAVDDVAGSKPSDAGYGIGFGDDRDGAERAALDKCKSFGNDGCKVRVWFETCGAYAASNDSYGIGFGKSDRVAKEKALDMCSGESCRVVAADCGN